MAAITIIITAIDATGAAIGTVEGKLGGLQTATTQAGGAMDKAGGQTVGFVDKIGRIAAGVVVAVAAMAAMNVVMETGVKQTLDYNTGLGKIQGLTDTSAEATKQLSGYMLNLGQSLPISPVELAAAGYFILSSGIGNVTDAQEILRVSSIAASANLGDVADVADVLTSALNAYGQGAAMAEHYTDVLVVAVREGKAEADEFGPALGKVIPVAAMMGVSFEEVAANLATATRAGYDVDLAATGLRQTLLNLYAPSKETTKALAEMGITADDVRNSLAERGLNATLADLMDITGGNVEVLDKLIPNVRGLAETLATAGVQAKSYREILKACYDSQDALNHANEVASQTLEYRLGVAWNKVQIAILKVSSGVLPDVVSGIELLITGAGKAAEFVGWLKDRFDDLPEPVQTVIKVVEALSLVFTGPVGLVLAAKLAGNAVIGAFQALPGVAETIVNAFIDIINGGIGVVNGLIGQLNRIPGVDLGKIGELGHISLTAAEGVGLLGQKIDAVVASEEFERSKTTELNAEIAKMVERGDQAVETAYGLKVGMSDTSAELDKAASAAGGAAGKVSELTAANLAALGSLKGLRDEIVGVAEDSLAKLQSRIDYYTDAVARLEEAEKTAEAQTSDWKEEVDRLEKAIGDAEDAIDSFADATIVGEEAMEDAIFNLGIQMDKLRLKISKLEEQKLLADGPDAVDKLDHAIEELEEELDRLGIEADQLEISKRLQFDPLHRQIEKLIDTTPELTFQEIIAGIEAQQALLPGLNEELGVANTQYEAWSGHLEAVSEALDIHKDALKKTRDAYDALADNLDALDPALKAVVEALGQGAVKSLNDAWQAMLTGQETAYDAALQEVYDLFDDIKTAADESGQTAIVQPFLDAISGATQVLEEGLATFPGIIAGVQPEVAEASTETAAGLISSFISALWLYRPQLADGLDRVLSAAQQVGDNRASATGFSAANALVAGLIDQLRGTGQSEAADTLNQMWGAFERASTGAAGTTGTASAVALTGGIIDKVNTEAQPTIDIVERTMSTAMTTLTNSAGLWGQSIGGYLQSGIYQSFLDNWEDYAEDIGQVILEGLQDALGAHSPATAMIPLGVAAAQGYAVGFAKIAGTVPLPVDVGNVHTLTAPGGSGTGPVTVILQHNGTLMGNEIEADNFARMIGERLDRLQRGVHV